MKLLSQCFDIKAFYFILCTCAPFHDLSMKEYNLHYVITMPILSLWHHHVDCQPVHVKVFMYVYKLGVVNHSERP